MREVRGEMTETKRGQERAVPQEYARGYALVDLDAIRGNLRDLKEKTAPGTRMMAVIKADGYGHGSVPVARCLEEIDYLYGYAVATAQEALELRRAGIQKPILILGYVFPCFYRELTEKGVRMAVFRRDTLPQLSEAAGAAGVPARIHVKVDTGMGRIGIRPDEEGLAFVREAAAAPGVEIEGIFTHFARADERDLSNAEGQLACFEDFVARAEALLGHRIPLRHCSNSAGILQLYPANLDLVRAGIALYGIEPSRETDLGGVLLRPALSLYSHLVYVKELFPGQSVSYGGTFTAVRPMRVATVPLGYGDGYPRSLSGKGFVLIRGRRAPILGRVCMDQFMVDVTEIPGAAQGDPVTLIGRDGKERITAEELGELSGRFHYELLCGISPRVPRVYQRGGKIL